MESERERNGGGGGGGEWGCLLTLESATWHVTCSATMQGLHAIVTVLWICVPSYIPSFRSDT